LGKKRKVNILRMGHKLGTQQGVYSTGSKKKKKEGNRRERKGNARYGKRGKITLIHFEVN